MPTHVHLGPIVTDVQSEEGTIGSIDPESIHWFRDRRLSNPARPWIYFLTYWRTHASRLLGEFGSRALPQQLCTTASGGARQIGGALVLVQICYIAAPADDGDYG
ncbi:hypothetical protein M9H77_08981 [Catharanthus roseus]|uniref:Uncharacterized protein n=1 Tax=Catharanthus roseus TaxID=4058 RepID=A0ACC0BZC5_CATRO|nr:hypothetical protein M9H77_08981 [Catharanthus roseus]